MNSVKRLQVLHMKAFESQEKVIKSYAMKIVQLQTELDSAYERLAAVATVEAYINASRSMQATLTKK